MMFEPDRDASKRSPFVQDAEGAWHWSYDFGMFTNPSILFLIWKIFGGILAVMWAGMMLMTLADGGSRMVENLLGVTQTFGVLVVGIGVLSTLGYIAYVVLVLGGTYFVVFRMDDKGVTHTQIDKQFGRVQVFAALTALAGAAAGKPGVAGSGILAGSRQSLSSAWSAVRKVRAYPDLNLIEVNGLLTRNQVYVDDEHFEFVRNYIVEHCGNAKIRG